MEETKIIDTTKRSEIWKRGLFMLVFALLMSAALVILNLVAVIQFFWLLFNNETNPNVARFGASLGRWFAEVARFQSATSDDKPFPWRAWPDAL